MPTPAQRTAARALGFCGICCKRRPSPGYKTCDTCRGFVDSYKDRVGSAEVHRQKHGIALQAQSDNVKAGFDEDGWCLECIAYLFHRYDCPLRLKRNPR